jgi:hypothetical protein
MCETLYLTILLASTACYMDSFKFLRCAKSKRRNKDEFYLVRKVLFCLKKKYVPSTTIINVKRVSEIVKNLFGKWCHPNSGVFRFLPHPQSSDQDKFICNISNTLQHRWLKNQIASLQSVLPKEISTLDIVNVTAGGHVARID